MDQNQLKALQREILLGFWKVHILHHATEGPVVGQWMLTELRRHGYEVSPGTLYPILHFIAWRILAGCAVKTNKNMPANLDDSTLSPHSGKKFSTLSEIEYVSLILKSAN